MKEYTFFIAGEAEEVSISSIIRVIFSKNLSLGKATLEAREIFIKDIKKKRSMEVTLITQFNLIGVQDVYEDENGEIKVKEVSNDN